MIQGILIALGTTILFIGLNYSAVFGTKMWKYPYRYYCFVDTDKNETFETYWSPEKGNVKLYIDGVLQTKDNQDE
jgi:hypothetical protein